MQPISPTPIAIAMGVPTSVGPNRSHETPAKAPVSGSKGGVHAAIGDALRGAGAGVGGVTRQEGIVVEKAAMVPFEAVVTVTSELKKATANVPVLGKATSLLHTITGFGMLIGAMTVSQLIRTPGDVAVSATHGAADLIDGKNTNPGLRGAFPTA